MSRIVATFDRLKQQNRAALIPFITAGDPSPGLTVTLLHALVAGGADLLELGVPFSDPMADGPTIQRASERALLHGVGLHQILEMVAEFRRADVSTPVILMGYANPVEAMGQEVFARLAAEAGVDGVLIVDYPPEESVEWIEALRVNDIAPIFLLAPTTPERRIAHVARVAKGFIYYVSLRGVTGSASLDLEDVAQRIPKIRSQTGLPVGVGFGIRDAASAAAMARIADAVVIGSRVIQEIENGPESTAVDRVTELMQTLRLAMDQARV